MKKPLFVPVTLLQRVVKFSVTKGKGFLAIILLFLFSSFSGAKDKQNYLISKTSSGLHPLVDYFEYAQKEYVQGKKQLSRKKDSYVLAAFAPPPTGNTLWFRADKGVDAADGSLDTDDTISTWHDQQGGDNNGIQAVVHAGESGESSHIPGMPSYVYTNTDHFNFNPLIRFDQTANGNSGEAVEFVTPSLNDQTVFVVFKNVRGFNNSNHYSQPPLYGNDISSPGNLNHIGGGNSNDRADIAFNYTANGNLAVGGGFSGDFNYRGTNGLNAATRSHAVIGVFTRDADGNDTAAFTLYANGSPDQNNGQPAFSTAGASRTGSGFSLTTPIRIGKHNSNDSNADSNLDGDVAEVLTFDGILSETDRKKVESYLAIKYGITLNGDTDQLGVTAGNVNYDYVDSDGNVIWTTDANYRRDIAGLGLDSGYDLNQQISKSVNPNAIVTMAIDTDFSEGNLKNRGSITEKDFLIWGNDGVALGEITTEIPASSVTHRLTREWRVQKTGTSITNVSVQIDLNGSSHTGTVNTLYLMVDKDNDGDFSTGTIEYFPAASLNGDVAQFNNVNFDNNNVFTVATRALVVIDPCDAAASGNTDTDGDGISDICDDDADNDGIIDGAECTINTTQIQITSSGANSIPITATATQMGGYPVEATAQGNVGTGTSGGLFYFAPSDFNVQATLGADDVKHFTELIVTSASFDDGIRFSVNGTVVVNFTQHNWEGQPEFATNGKFDVSPGGGWQPWNNEGNPELTIRDGSIELLVDTTTNDSSGNPIKENALKYMVNHGTSALIINNAFTYDYYATGGADFRFEGANHDGPYGLSNVQIRARTYVCKDTDKDGTIDNLDVDADADGCYDAIEGAGSFTTANLTSSNSLADADEGAVNEQGIPTNTGSPQAIGSAAVNTSITVTTTSSNIAVQEGANETLQVNATASQITDFVAPTNTDVSGQLIYTWELSTDGGTNYSAVTGTSNSLALTNVSLTQNNHIYRVTISHPNKAGCNEEVLFTLNVTPFDPCTDAAGTDTDGDGINDVCDEDDDNDGILDINECFGTTTTGTLVSDIVGTGISVNKANWDNVLSNLESSQYELEGFETYANDTNLNGLVANGFTMAVTNNTGSTRQYDIDGAEYGTNPLNGTKQATIQIPGTPEDVTLTLTFDEPVVGFGLNLGDIHDGGSGSKMDIYFDTTLVWSSDAHVGSGSTGTVTNDLPSGESLTLGNQIFGFIGYYDLDNPVSTVRIEYEGRGSGDNFVIDDVSFIKPFCDTDNDGIPNYLDTDADNDGCPDASEGANNITTSLVALAGGSNGGSSLHLGTTVNGQGVPTNTGSPQATTTEVVNATRLTVNTNPINSSVASGATTSFTVAAIADTATSYTTGTPNYGTSGNADAGINYQWYLGDPSTTGVALTEAGVYYGTITNTLTILDVSGLNGNEYYVVITHDDNECLSEVRSATLTVAATINPCDAAASGNTDTDGDGISDICDNDDDNDGILDEDELSCATIGGAETITGVDYNNVASVVSTVNTTHRGSASGSGAVTLTYGQGNYRYIQDITFSSGNKVAPTPLVGDGKVYIRRNSVSDNNHLIWIENNGNYRQFVTTKPNTDEEVLELGSISLGKDNTFVNATSEGSRSNIERVDLVFENGISSNNVQNNGFLVMERGHNDDLNVAAITSVDASGTPTGYKTMQIISQSELETLYTPNYTVMIKESGQTEFGPNTTNSSSQDLGMYFLTLDELGVAANETIYGFSFFPGDLTSTTPADLLDWNNAAIYPTNTPSATGGEDLTVIKSFVSSCIEIDTDNDGIPDYHDLDADADGCPDAIEGTGNFTNADLVNPGTDDSLGDTVETDSTSPNYGVPTISGSPQEIGSAILNTTITLTTTSATINVQAGNNETLQVNATASQITDFITPTSVDVTAGLVYTWELSTDGGSNYSAVTGTTNSLALTNVALAQNNHIYKVTISHPNKGGCDEEVLFTLNVTADPCDAAASGNTDTDGDGISDICDVDDDNDGILDVDEQASCGIFGDPSMEADDDSLPGHGSNYDSFANSFPSSSAWSNSNGTAGFFIAGQIPTSLDTALEPYEGNSYIGFHSQGTYTNEVFRNNLTANIVNGNSYTIAFAAYQMNLIAPAGGGNLRNSGSVKFFGIKNGTNPTLNGANQANPTTIEAIPEVDLLATSALVDNTTAWKVYTVTFTAADDYDRVLISVDGTDSFLGFDNIRMACNLDTDNDGIFNHLDTDSDNDGCPDASEGANNITTGLVDLAGGSNGGSIKNLGTTVNAQGVPNNGGTSQVQNTTTEVVNATRLNAVGPTDVSVVSGVATSFTVTATADTATSYTTGTPDYGTLGNANTGINYQWYLGDPTVPANILSNTGVYSNVTTATLNISDVTGLTGNQYFVVVTHDDNECISVVESATLTIINPALTVEKRAVITDNAPLGVTGLGDEITYTITVENTGDVTLTNITLADSFTSGAGVGTLTPVLNPATQDASTLAVGATLTYTVSHTITQADVDAGSLSNTVIATGKDPNNNDVTDESDDDAGATDGPDPGTDTDDDPTVNPLDQNPALTVEKRAVITDNAPLGVTGLGDEITYTITVENTGDVTLTNITLADSFTSGAGVGTLTPVLNPATQDASTLAVGTTLTYTVSHTITQADVDAGSLSNTVTATGKDPNNNDVTDESDDDAGVTDGPDPGTDTDDDPTVNPLDQNPALTVEKRAVITDNAPLGVTGLGDEITYTITVENTGDVTLTNITLADSFTSGAGVGTLTPVLNPATQDASTLVVGATLTYTVSHTITQADVDAGSLSNTVTATGKDPNNNDVTDESDDDAGATDGPDPGTDTDDDPTVNPLDQNPALTVEKRAAITDNAPLGVTGLGDEITYTITVENTGDVTLTNITLADSFTSGAGVGTLTPVLNPATQDASTLAVGATLTYTVSHTITQADVDAGSLSNTVTVTGKDPNNNDVTDESDDDAGATDGPDPGTDTDDDPTVNPLDQNPALTVEKRAAITDNAPLGVTGLGDEITYTITVENTGDVTLTNITLADSFTSGAGVGTLTPVLNPATQDASTLAVGATLTYTVSHTITQADVDAGSLSNTVTATGKDPNNNDVTDESDDDAGATDGPDPGTDTDDDPTVNPLDQNPALTVEKRAAITDNAPLGVTGLGDEITYTITVENTGDVTLTNITLADSFTSGAGVGTLTPVLDPATQDASTLAVGATLTYTVSHTITQADVDAGSLSNTVTATGKDPNNNDVTDESDDDAGATDGPDPGTDTDDDPTVNPLDQNPALTVEKRAVITDNAPLGVTGLGDEITYTITVENTGDVTLTNITLADSFTSGAGVGTLTPVLNPATQDASTLAVGATLTYTVSHTITQADVDAGSLSNTVTATGKDPNNNDVTDESDDDAGATDGPDPGTDTDDDPTVNPLDQNPALTVEKRAAITDNAPLGVTGLGDEITYTVTVENTGDVTLTNITLADSFTSGAGVGTLTPVLDPATQDASTLAVGATLTYTVSHTITQADVDAGSLSNTVTATGKDPNNNDVTDESDDDAGATDGPDPGTDTDDDPTVNPLDQNPALTVEKRAVITDNAPLGVTGLGDEITYTITVENTGDVTLTNITLADSFTSGAGVGTLTPVLNPATQDASTLAVGATLTYTVSHTITQADVDAGSLSNTVTATGKDPNNNDVTDESDDDAGATDGPDPGTDTDDDPTVNPLDQNPALTVEKRAVITDNAPLGVTGLGDEITYTITVENTGDVTLTNITLADSFTSGAGVGTLTPVLNPATQDASTLAVGATLTYTVSHTITQADVDAGSLSNTVTATGKDPNNNDVTDESDDDAGATDGPDPGTDTDDDPTVNPLDQNPALTVEKRAAITDNAPLGVTGLGDEITYTVTVENTGDVTLTNITLADSFTSGAGVGTLTPVLDPATQDASTLAVGATLTYTVSHTITQADVDAGSLSNTVTATGKDPNNNDVTDESDDDAGATDGPDPGTDTDDDPTVNPLDQNPALTVEKRAVITDNAPLGVTGLGDEITYTITVENTGDVTLTNITLADSFTSGAGVGTLTPVLNPATQDASTLAVGATLTYTVSHTITQADVDAGSLSNTVTATGKDPNNNDVTDESDDDAGATDGPDPGTDTDDDPTVNPLDQNPAIALEKSFAFTSGTGNAVGDIIEYTFEVTNTGDVTVNSLSITDTKLSLTNAAVTPSTLAPGAVATLTANYTLTQVDLDAGRVVNTATANGLAPDGTTGVSDTSDTGTNADGSTIAGDTNTVENPESDGTNDGDATNDPTISALTQTPAIKLEKSFAFTTGTGNAVGDVIEYTFEVTNTGNVTVSNLTVTDAKLGLTNAAVTPSTLAPGAVATLTANYTLTQADLDAGRVVNTATANGLAPDGTTGVSDTSDTGTNADGSTIGGDTDTVENPESDGTNDGDATNDPTISALTQTPAITLEKSFAFTSGTGNAVGDVIEYTFEVTNTGNVTVSNLTVTDAKLGLTNAAVTPSTLVPGAVATLTANYTLTQVDLDGGRVVNTATANGLAPDGTTGVSDTSDTGTNADGSAIAGDTDTVENPESDGTNDGDATNDPTISALTQNPAITLEKSFAFTSGTGNAVGDVIEYTFEVTNTGNVTVSNLTVTDAKLGLTNVTVTPSTLVPGAVAILTANYTITQADLDAGLVVNSATAIGKDPNNTDVTDTSDAGTNSDGSDVTTPEDEDTDGDTSNGDDDDPTTTDLTQTPEITLEKSFSFTTGNGSAVGDVLTYSLVVTNTGNVTIDNVSITDAKLGLTNEVVTPSTLAPGVSATLIRAYTITQADLNAGEVVNTAVAEGTDPKGNNITDTSDAGTAPDGTDVTTPEDDDTDGDASNGDDDDPTISTLIQTPVLVLEKSFTFTSGTGNAVGDVIEYTFEVTNTGNVTVDNISITDAKLGMTDVAVTPSTLNPGESTTLTANYTVTQADLDAGEVVNTAVAEGEDPKGNDVSDISDAGTNSDGSDVTNPEDEDTDGDTSNGDDDDPTTTDLTQNPSIILEKSFAFTNGIGDTVGDEITYTFEVTNTGNVTVNNLTVTDAKLGLTNAAVSPSSIAPGATATLRATYAITQADLDAGEVVNTAVAEGEDPKGNDVSDTSDAGTNSDGSDVTNPEDEDTDGDASNGDDDDDTISDLIQDPAITVVKTIVDADTQVGGEVTYRITVTNTGNITVNTVRVTDAMLGLTNEDLTPSTLAPGESAFIESVYTITQADMDRGYVENTASGSAVGVNGDTVNDISDTDIDGDGNGIGNHEEVDSPDGEGNTDGDSGNDVTVLTLEQEPSIMLTKNAEYVDTDGNLYVSVGDVINYTFEVTNTGNVTLTNITVEDTMLVAPYGEITGGPIASLMVGETDTTTFTGTYQIQQSDIDRGWVENTAEAIGFDADGIVEVKDTSDTGTDGDGNSIPDNENDETPDGDGSTDGDTTNDPTVTTFDKSTCLTIYNEFSPNGDGDNDFFEIDCIESYPGNNIEIFNRWGNTVYKKTNYDNSWDGTSNGRATVNGSDKLPVGTYYYVLDLNDGSKPRTGWLYLNR